MSLIPDDETYAIEMNWRVNAIKMAKILKGHEGYIITCLEFCGDLVVSGSDDNTLKVWSVLTGMVSFKAVCYCYVSITLLSNYYLLLLINTWATF